jgi:metalloendopeptidase OMA1, mitochondrial
MDRRTWVKYTALGGLGACGCLGGCKTAPVTGRRQMMFYPEQQEVAMGKQSFADVVSKEPISTNSRFQQLVERVGRRIADVSGRGEYEWETKVVASDEQNAFCLPGGKIVVYEGILPVCQNEAGLAVVMSHEVAHVLARHGGERMSQTAAVNGIHTGVSFIMRNKEQVTQDLWNRAYGIGTNFGFLLPYSRKHESEADHIGLMLMSQAGYDPAEAPRFWTRFSSANTSAKPPEFLSTHPADSRRASDLEKLLPEALEHYRKVVNPVGQGEAIV